MTLAVDALVLPAHVRRQVVADARWRAPHECCGFLVGRGDVIAWARPIPNSDPDPAHAWRIALEDQRRAFRHIEACGLDLIGVYHSHVKVRAYPSERDVALAYYPEAAWMIVGLSDPSAPDVRAYRIVQGVVSEIELRGDA